MLFSVISDDDAADQEGEKRGEDRDEQPSGAVVERLQAADRPFERLFRRGLGRRCRRGGGLAHAASSRRAS